MLNKWFGLWRDENPDDVSPKALFGHLSQDEDKRLVALRAALRVFPASAAIGAGRWELGSKTALPIRLHSIRLLYVTWSGFAFEGVREEARREAFRDLSLCLAELDAGLPEFFEQNFMGNEYQTAAAENRAFAARRAVSLVEAVGKLSFDDLPFDGGHSCRSFLDILVLDWETQQRWRRAQAQGIGADCAVLSDRTMSRRELAMAPLWPNPIGASMETHLLMGHANSNVHDLGFAIERWRRERKDGALVFLQQPAKAAERAVRLANLPASYWNRRDADDTLYAWNECFTATLDSPSWADEERVKPAWLKDA